MISQYLGFDSDYIIRFGSRLNRRTMRRMGMRIKILREMQTALRTKMQGRMRPARVIRDNREKLFLTEMSQ